MEANDLQFTLLTSTTIKRKNCKFKFEFENENTLQPYGYTDSATT